MLLTLILVPLVSFACYYLLRKYREYTWGWVRMEHDLTGKVFIVTGANTGLGFEVTRGLIKRGATVVLACRNLAKANEAIAKIRAEFKDGRGEMVPLELDLASFDSIRSFVQELRRKFARFDCLVNNAGLAVRDEQLTADGIELHTGTNHIGPFLLTNLLLDDILRHNARVVMVGSRVFAIGEIDFENFGKFTKPPAKEVFNFRYNNTKLMNFYFAKELCKRGIDAYYCCTGFCDTNFFRDYKPGVFYYLKHSLMFFVMLRTPEQGAQSILYCALENANSNEKNPNKSFIVFDCKQNKAAFELSDDVAERLWMESAKLCGLK